VIILKLMFNSYLMPLILIKLIVMLAAWPPLAPQGYVSSDPSFQSTAHDNDQPKFIGEAVMEVNRDASAGSISINLLSE
jgi:hypothetical protein